MRVDFGGSQSVDVSGSSNDELLLVQDPERDVTVVGLYRARAGAWSVTTREGSPPIAGIRVAEGLPTLRVSARVAAKGARRLLTWRADGLAGGRLQLLEQSGGTARLLTTTRRSRGRLRFRPDGKFGARRTIEAIAFDGALPRSRTTVARFRVAPPPRPRRVTRMRLAGRRLSWRAARGASSYEIAIRLPDTTTRNLTASRPRVRLPRLPARGRLQVGIVGVNARGEAGPVASSRLELRR